MSEYLYLGERKHGQGLIKKENYIFTHQFYFDINNSFND